MRFEHPTFGPAYRRVVEISQAERGKIDRWEEERERLGIKAAADAFDAAGDAKADAIAAMLNLRPNTAAGLRALVVTLFKAGTFQLQDEGDALARLLIESPGLAVEA